MALNDAVLAQLEAWKLAGTALGASALDIADRLAEDDLRPAAAAMLHGQLRGYLADLAKLAPEEQTSDDVDEVTARREQRRRAAGL